MIKENADTLIIEGSSSPGSLRSIPITDVFREENRCYAMNLTVTINQDYHSQITAKSVIGFEIPRKAAKSRND